MTDKREDILVRLLAIAGGIDGVATAERNLDEIADIKRPAIILFDADELVPNADGGTHQAAGPVIVDMIPQLRILIGTKVADIGSDLNIMRARLMKAILTDEQLVSLTGRPGRIRYHSGETALGHGRTMDGDMVLRFTITYLLNPNKL